MIIKLTSSIKSINLIFLSLEFSFAIKINVYEAGVGSSLFSFLRLYPCVNVASKSDV